jgi:predicted amidohydrolase
VPFGNAILEFVDTSLASETCEELFTPSATHIHLALNGVEITTNGSGSHHQLRKLDQRMELIQSATRKAGGVYLYANQVRPGSIDNHQLHKLGQRMEQGVLNQVLRTSIPTEHSVKS